MSGRAWSSRTMTADKSARCSGDAPRDHLIGSLAQPGCIQDALQLLLHEFLARGLHAAPLTERSDETRGNLAVHRVKLHDGVGKKAIAAAAWLVESHLIAGGEAAHQCAHPVRHLQVEIR